MAIVLAATAVVIGPLAAVRSDDTDSGLSTAKIDVPVPKSGILNGEDIRATSDSAQSAQPQDTKDAPQYTADTIPAVTGLTKDNVGSDGIRLHWDNIPGVRGYRVYFCDKANGESDYTLFSTVTAPSLSIRNLDTGSLYGVKVTAFISDGNKTPEGDAAGADCATAPDKVTGFTVADQTKSKTTIKWDKNERADGYILQRCYNGEWSEYERFDADTTEFTDTELKGGRAYFYRINAFREDSFSQLDSGTEDVYTVAGLLGPKDDGSESKLGRVSLDYKKNDYADGYEIYYSTDKEDWEQLTDTTRAHYSTSRLVDGETYYFRIYSYKDVSYLHILGGYTELEFVAKKEIYDKEVGDTYVEVSLDDQHMWYIVDGDVYLESDCVTGNYGSADTPKGYFAINGKASPCTLKGEDYVSYVTYWMPFIGGGWGLHDATWRSSFGGSIYRGNGSHGCVNLPYDIAKELYAHTEEGTPVIVY